MEAFLIYLSKSCLLLSIFSLVYYFLLRKDTFFTINRHFLLSGMIISVLLPLVEFNTIVFVERPGVTMVPQEIILTQPEEITKINWWLVGLVIYSIGVLVLLIRFVLQLLSLHKLFKENSSKKVDNYTIIEVKDEIAPFSFFNTIVYNPSLHEHHELEMILAHEKIHVTQLHTLDIVLINTFMIFQWFNPFVWFFKHGVEQNLEFIADREAVINTVSKKEYQLTLVRVCSNNYSSITNNFYQSLIKKRIVMLNKGNSQKKNALKTMFILPLLGLFLWSFNTKEVIMLKEDTHLTPKEESIADNQKVVKFEVNKNSTEKDFENIKKTLKDKFKVTIKFSDIKRNGSNEITSIEIEASSEKSNVNYAIEDDAAIQPFIITYNDQTNSINIGKASTNSSYVWVNKDGKHIEQIIEIDTDNDNEDHEIYVVPGGKKAKVIRKKDKNGKVIIEEIHEGDSNDIFEIRTDDKKTFAFISGDRDGEPLIIIDGKKATKKEMEKLDSDDIKEINVYKGEKAIEKYGKEAKNGVVEITTKK
ncbi:hypothetical protein M0D21_09550 [Aquimarina sp. D1M17]|uniref:M56 family metallopeptidase n=1 Tax=Aquimarina acroporae TaxID=2937283 RepID=UPI0020BFE0B7|nr:M56 family metallopeptidase [Aquimarina acroporae]MCK8521815.1 hypothetical protein [Aquimarina acroporae]